MLQHISVNTTVTFTIKKLQVSTSLVSKLEAGHSIKCINYVSHSIIICDLTCDLDIWPFDPILINGWGITMDNLCSKFGDFRFQPFWFYRVHRQTESHIKSQTGYTHANTLVIKLTNKHVCSCPLNLHAPQRSPSISILRTHSSSLAMSVSSSHGFTSRMMFDLATATGSVIMQVTNCHHKPTSSTMSNAECPPNNQK